MSALDEFYLSKEEPSKSCLLVLRKLILEQDKSINETKKYGMPCFCYGKKCFVTCGQTKKPMNLIFYL